MRIILFPVEGGRTQRIMPSQRILLVDDHEDTLHVMKLLLKKQGREIVCARSIAEAVGLARRQSFDLGLLDLFLPDGIGVSILQELRAVQDFPCIALTGSSLHHEVAASLAAGFCRHLIKPCPLEELEQAIAECLAPPLGAAGSSLSPK
jgi:CheY-like chemotaxis protein